MVGMTAHVDQTRIPSKRKFVPDDNDTGKFLIVIAYLIYIIDAYVCWPV